MDTIRTQEHNTLSQKRGERIHMIYRILVPIILVLFLAQVPALAGNSEKEKAAVISAEAWVVNIRAPSSMKFLTMVATLAGS
jgi:hypothetical protein